MDSYKADTECSAAYLRQSIVLAAYETPEGRSLFNSSLQNVAGKIRTQRFWSPIEVPQGIEQVGRSISSSRRDLTDNSQNFVHFECANAKDEADKRFHHFTTQVGLELFSIKA
ncbi:hypothetical protein H0H81_007650 [Sphagnurus paluster]|uniref:Uncharacterized protein n=1 Tax=Sphagnurus paluster TaxID=117069 RepID=A0A9P7G1G3_9AGAR|nr:hypothetical protein H0H81_007650 [Sphagnurus paluster]